MCFSPLDGVEIPASVPPGGDCDPSSDDPDRRAAPPGRVQVGHPAPQRRLRQGQEAHVFQPGEVENVCLSVKKNIYTRNERVCVGVLPGSSAVSADDDDALLAAHVYERAAMLRPERIKKV